MLPDDTLEALLRYARTGHGPSGYSPQHRTWKAIDAALTEAWERGYVVLPEVPKDAQFLVDDAWWHWSMRHGQPTVIVFRHGRRSTLRLTLPWQRVLCDAQVVELTAMARAACAYKDARAYGSATHLRVTLWTMEAEAFAAVVRDYVLEHMEPVPQLTPPVLTANGSQ
jgi:hypothetical protein